MMKLLALVTLFMRELNCEICTTNYVLTPYEIIASTSNISVVSNGTVTEITYDQDDYDNDSIYEWLSSSTDSSVTMLQTNCISCDLCDYCTYDPTFDNTFGTGGVHNFLCLDGSNCNGCDLVQSYVPNICNSTAAVNDILIIPEFANWNVPFKESCPHKCEDQQDCTLRCPHTQVRIDIAITFDDSPEDIHWQLSNNETIFSQGGYYNKNVSAFQTIHSRSCVNHGCYALSFIDTSSDGFETGKYRVNIDDTTVIYKNGSFGSSIYSTFCTGSEPEIDTSSVSPPPPSPAGRTFLIEFQFAAQGTISDFDAYKKFTLRSRLASSLGILVSEVNIATTAGSITITVDITLTGTETAAKQVETYLIANTNSTSGINELFENQLTAETTPNILFREITTSPPPPLAGAATYCECKTQWTYPCTDGIQRNGCDANSCNVLTHSSYCPAVDPNCSPNPSLYNSQMSALQNTTGNEFVFWCAPVCEDDPSGEIQLQGWGSSPTLACTNIVTQLQISNSETLQEVCDADLSGNMGILLKHYCPVACNNVSPLCAASSPPPGAASTISPPSSPSPTNSSSPSNPPSSLSPTPPHLASPPSTPPTTPQDNSTLLAIAIILGVLIGIGGITITVRRYITVEVVDLEVASEKVTQQGIIGNSTLTHSKISNNTSVQSLRPINPIYVKPVPTNPTNVKPAPTNPPPTLPISYSVANKSIEKTKIPLTTIIQPQSSVNQVFVPSKHSPRRSRSRSRSPRGERSPRR